jgi:endonuclease-3
VNLPNRIASSSWVLYIREKTDYSSHLSPHRRHEIWQPLELSLRRLDQQMKSSMQSGSGEGPYPLLSRRVLRAKTARIARLLEEFLGTPRQPTHLPTPLEMLIATILSQNTNDKNSHRAYSLLRKKYRSWNAIARAPRRSLIATIRVGGMANQKSVRIKETLAAVKAQYGDYDLADLREKSNDDVIHELTQMKGIGVKTASCVLLFAMGRDVFPVDTHVHRICTRLGLASGGNTPEKTFVFMKSLVPKGKGYSLHTNLIRFGRKVCRSNNPACDICPLYDECVYESKGRRDRVNRTLTSADHDFMLLDNV